MVRWRCEKTHIQERSQSAREQLRLVRRMMLHAQRRDPRSFEAHEPTHTANARRPAPQKTVRRPRPSATLSPRFGDPWSVNARGSCLKSGTCNPRARHDRPRRDGPFFAQLVSIRPAGGEAVPIHFCGGFSCTCQFVRSLAGSIPAPTDEVLVSRQTLLAGVFGVCEGSAPQARVFSSYARWYG